MTSHENRCPHAARQARLFEDDDCDPAPPATGPRERRQPARAVASEVSVGDVEVEPLTLEVVEELGRILGEALIQQYQRDTAAMGAPPSGPNHRQPTSQKARDERQIPGPACQDTTRAVARRPIRSGTEVTR